MQRGSCDFIMRLTKDVYCELLFPVCDAQTLGRLLQTCHEMKKRLEVNKRVIKWRTLFEKDDADKLMCKAAKHGEEGLVRVAISYGAWYFRDGLYASARGDHADLISLFIEKGAPLCYGLRGACHASNKRLVDWFLEKGVDLIDCSYSVFDSLGNGGDIELMRYILAKIDTLNIDAHERQESLNSGLYGSCQKGHHDFAEEMFSLGATGVNGAMHSAIQGKRDQIARWLISEKGFDDWYNGFMSAAANQTNGLM